MLLGCITVLLLVLYACLIFFYYYHWQQLPNFIADNRAPKTFVTVLIAARNEEQTLPFLLKALQTQTYPSQLLEILVVDDFSTDATSAVMQRFLSDHIHRIQPAATPENSSKKKAIESGVMAAKGELLLITDADCIPKPDWIATMVNMYEKEQAVFIAAPVKFTANSTLLQRFQSLDFMMLQGITAASVQARFHSMCNGANLAYTRQAFLAVDGFTGIDKVASGDDMLLMHKMEKSGGKTVYLKSQEAIVTTQPMNTWKDFFAQRKRWASKTTYYDDHRITAVLFFIYLFNCFFLVLLVAAFFNAVYWWLVAAYLVGKTLVEIIFLYSIAKFYNEEKNLWYFPLFQPLHILYTVSIGFISQLGRYEWKGRKTK